MQDFCQVTRHIRMSSNPTGGILIKFFFTTFTFWRCIFLCVFFFVYCLFVFIVCVCVCFVVLYFIFSNIMKFQDASCPSLAVSVLSSSVEPPSQSLAVSVSFLNVRFDRSFFSL